jgi:hypothetical protein
MTVIPSPAKALTRNTLLAVGVTTAKTAARCGTFGITDNDPSVIQEDVEQLLMRSVLNIPAQACREPTARRLNGDFTDFTRP